jgi:hypothetical protein
MSRNGEMLLCNYYVKICSTPSHPIDICDEYLHVRDKSILGTKGHSILLMDSTNYHTLYLTLPHLGCN